MITRPTLLGFCVCLLFISCQREVDWNVPNTPGGGSSSGTGPQLTPGGGSNGTILLRIVRKNNLDSVVASFTYNSADKFLSYVCLGKERYDTFNITYNIRKYFERDANNRIVRYTSPSLLDTTLFGAVDSTRSYVHYPSASSTEFDYVITKTDGGMFMVTDSSVYSYTAGRASSVTSYMSNPLLQPTPAIVAKTEFTYDAAGNMIEEKSYSADPFTQQLQLSRRTVNTYDSKPNAHHFKNEGLLLQGTYYGPNNTIKAVMTVSAQTNIVNLAYNYNAQNLPKNALMTANNPNRSFTFQYFYR